MSHGWLLGIVCRVGSHIRPPRTLNVFQVCPQTIVNVALMSIKIIAGLLESIAISISSYFVIMVHMECIAQLMYCIK